MKNKKGIILVICLAIFSIVTLMLVTSYAIPDNSSANLDEILQSNKITMKSDYETVDSYKDYFDKESTKMDGKVWTDKSVYNYQKTKGNVVLDKNLSYLNNGKGFNIDYNSEFLHVFSALGSSQVVENENVVDFLIVIDMSGSMGIDVVDKLAHEDEKTRIAHSRIQVTIDSVNKTIDTLMNQNKENRVAVVVYGATAYTLMELGHYQKIANSNTYITVENFKAYNEIDFTKENSSAYTLRLKAIKDGKEIERSVRNNYTEGKSEEQLQKAENWVGFHTNLQAGIYLGFNELYNNADTKTLRHPVAVVMSDGGSNYGLKRDDENPNVGDEWYDVPLQKSVPKYQSNFTMYRAEFNEAGKGGKEAILETLLTASFMKSKVLHKYEEVTKNIIGYDIPIDFQIHTVSVDTPDIEWQVPRVYTTLNPATYFKQDLPNVNWKFKIDATDAYKLFEDWKVSKDGIVSKFIDNDGIIQKEDTTEYQEKELKINKLPGETYGVTNEDVIANINYNDTFEDIEAAKLEDYFTNIVTNKNEIFKPISDTDNQSALTYQDPIGEYLEVKNVEKLLLFGKEYNIILANKENNKQYYRAVDSKGEDITLQNENYLTPLSFKLSDIIIWVETDSQGQEQFNIKIPSVALPIKVNKIKIDNSKKVLEYKETVDTASNLPIRVLYTVGLKSELIGTNSKINLSNIATEYIEKNAKIIDGHEYIYFNSNYYNNNSYGEAKTTIIPSKNNIYFYYQENLPIYETSNGGDSNGEGELTSTGGKVVLTNNIKKLTDISKDKDYYYILEYYIKTASGQKRVEYAVKVKGSDFYDEEGNLILTYYDTISKKEVSNFGENIIVTTKIGSKRINDFEEVIRKSENITETADSTLDLKEQTNSLIYYLGNNGKLLVPNIANLEIRKEVLGDKGEKNKEWEFQIRLTPKEGIKLENAYSYIGGNFIEGVEALKNGNISLIKQTDGSYLGTIKLKHGQSITIPNIEVGTTYEIIEKEANQDNYNLKVTNDKGIINKKILVYFENTKGFTLPKTGELGTILPAFIGTFFIGFGVYIFFYIKNHKKKVLKID